MDEALAQRFGREWLGEGVLLEPVDAMNSSTWLVRAGADRYVVKIASPVDAPGLAAAAWLEEHGLRTGAPLRTAESDGRLVALLRFADGRPLESRDAEAIGRTLARAHQLLRGAPTPSGMVTWPWPWLDLSVIDEPDLHDAAATAVERAESLAPALTHGVLHGDPAPEAFLEADGEVALIDWGAACHGPLLYDVASAWMYTRRDPRLIDGYARGGAIVVDELRHVPEFLAFRWAVQAWYFAVRVASRDLTGVESQAENEEGLADARAALLG